MTAKCNYCALPVLPEDIKITKGDKIYHIDCVVWLRDKGINEIFSDNPKPVFSRTYGVYA